MAGIERSDTPIWAASKAKKQIDILKEVARALTASDLERAKRPLAAMTQTDLESEQYRLEEWLDDGTITVDDFRRLREIDFYLHEMRQRRANLPTHPEWRPESLSD